MKKAIVLLATIVVALTALAQREYSLSSPDGRLVATVQVEQGGMSYSVEYGNHFLTPTTVIGLRYEQGGKVYDKMTVRKVSRRTIDETIPSPFSRQATMRNHCNEMTLTLKEGLSVVFRAYNEGVAFGLRDSLEVALHRLRQRTLPAQQRLDTAVGEVEVVLSAVQLLVREPVPDPAATQNGLAAPLLPAAAPARRWGHQDVHLRVGTARLSGDVHAPLR